LLRIAIPIMEPIWNIQELSKCTWHELQFCHFRQVLAPNTWCRAGSVWFIKTELKQIVCKNWQSAKICKLVSRIPLVLTFWSSNRSSNQQSLTDTFWAVSQDCR
jgi:hypothetical protein